MAPFQAAKIPLMKGELFGGLDLGQAQRLAVALEACAERGRRWHQPLPRRFMLGEAFVLRADRVWGFN